MVDAIYHIRLKGKLDRKWETWFDGFAMHARDDSVTLLSGSVMDQAALQGVLNKIHSLGLELIFLARIDCPCASEDCPDSLPCDQCTEYSRFREQPPFCFRKNTWWDAHCRTFKRQK